MSGHIISANPNFRNEILAALPPIELHRLRPHLTRGRMVSGQSLHDAGESIQQVFFFEEGFASLVAIADEGSHGVEVGVVGRDSVVGLGAAFSAGATSYTHSLVQLAGIAYRMPASVLRAAVPDCPVLFALLLRSYESLIAQSAQTVACNSRHVLTQRCARWLLVAHDRADSNELLLTQEFLSIMLAVRRSGVTVAVATLGNAGLIRTTRGRVFIADRAGLEKAACSCYQRVQRFTAGLQDEEANSQRVPSF